MEYVTEHMTAIYQSLFFVETWLSLSTLTLLEIVLGIDNIIFLSIICARLPPHQQKLGRQLGLGMALVGRIIFLASLAWLTTLTNSIAAFGSFELSWRDVILLLGGLFLMYKATMEIHASIAGHDEDERKVKRASFGATILQIGIIDVVFALDSMITAVGMAEHLWVMVVANVVAIVIMLFFAEKVAAFIARFPTIKMLALSFLMLVGVALVADGMHFHIPRGYIYFAIAFSIATESLNLLVHAKMQKRKAARGED